MSADIQLCAGGIMVGSRGPSLDLPASQVSRCTQDKLEGMDDQGYGNPGADDWLVS